VYVRTELDSWFIILVVAPLKQSEKLDSQYREKIMQQINITVADIIAPAEGKKQGKVVDTTGKKWGVWADKLHLYQRGGQYQIINYKTNNFNGVDYYVIDKIMPLGDTPTKPSYAASASAPTPAPTGKYGAPDDATAERIFVAGPLNKLFGNPNVNPLELTTDEIAGVVNNLREVWNRTFGFKFTAPTTGRTSIPDDMNDEIPDFK
jgi:hypothetical protein